MIQITPQMRILVAVEPADFRCGIDGLARRCRENLGTDPFTGTVFVFRNRRRTAVRGLGLGASQRQRCNLCGAVFTAEPPAGVGNEKYDATSASMIALLKYGSGLPFSRLERLQGNLGLPLPAATQWEIVQEASQEVQPAFQELVRQAAQGRLLHNDDTSMQVLDLKRQIEGALASGEADSDRTGIFTTSIVSELETGERIALYFTGRKHAGENLADLLRQRGSELQPPLQMCDGLDRNLPKEFATILGPRAWPTQVRRGGAELPRGVPLRARDPTRGVQARRHRSRARAHRPGAPAVPPRT
jgi:transposase